MSRIGRLPVVVPAGVQVDIKGSKVHVKGPKGELERIFSPDISITMDEGVIGVQRDSDEPSIRALHGTTRALINNMVEGVHTGFTVTLRVEGVGYRAELDDDTLTLHVGYSHAVVVEPPDGVNFEVDTKTRIIKVHGYNKEIVGQVAADIRKKRPPEPYKGKGIRYENERVRRKAGKSGKAI